MSKKKELIKNTIIILVGKVCTQFISFLLLPLYTAILSTEQYGIVDIVTTYVGLFAPLITLQLENSLFRYLVDARDDEKEKNKIITNTLFTSIILFFIAFIIVIVISKFIYIPYKYYIVGMVFSVICSNLMLQISRGNGNTVDFSVGSAIAGITTILFNILFLVILKIGIEGMFLSTIFANIMCSLYIFIKEKIYLNIIFNLYEKKTYRKLLEYSIPLVPNGLMWWIINVSDRTMITMYIGNSANGIYSVANKFSNIIIQVYNIFNISWTESAAVHINDEDRDKFFSETIQETLDLFSAISICMIAVMPILFKVFINEQYSEAYRYIPILIMSTLFNVIVGLISVIYVAKKMTKKIAQTSFYSGVINIIINVLCIKLFGVYAACYSTLIAFATMAIYRFVDAKKYVNIKLKIKNIIAFIIVFTIITYIYYCNNVLWTIVGIIIASIFGLKINKNIIKKSLVFVKNLKEKFV